MIHRLSCAIALFCASAPSFAAELEVRYPVIERILADQLFSQEGRLYVKGNKTTKCQFAYLESPHVGSNNGRLRISARFSGRTALDMFGRCVGLGDSFDLTLTASPVVKNGALAFADINVSTARDSFYIRKVRQALTGSFAKDFKLEIKDQAKRLLEQPAVPGAPKSVYQQELQRFDLTGVVVQPEGIVLVIDFRLVVK